MKFMLSLLAFGYVALANPAPSLPVNPGGIGGLFKGPNSETIIKGPDGSVITAAADGGEVISNVEPIVLAEPAVVEVAAAPTVNAVTAAPVIEAVAVPAAAVDAQQSSDLIGPSGRIATHGSQSVVAGPASTTVTGPAVIAETVVKGPPIIGAPALNAAAPALAITGSAVPVSVTPAPLATITAEIGPISVTASPIASAPVSVTPSPWPVVTNAGLDRRALISGAPISIVTPSVATVTAAPPVGVTTASALSHLSVASASSIDGASAIASVSPNAATAAVEGLGGVPTVTVTPVPIFQSTVGPIESGGQISSLGSIGSLGAIGSVGRIGSLDSIGSSGPIGPTGRVASIGSASPTGLVGLVGPGPGSLGRATLGGRALGVGINNRVDVGPQLFTDQVAVDNRQLNLNPVGIASGHLLPPEIAVTPRIPLGRFGPTPGTILTTPGLGAIATSTNIQREEGDIALSVTPSTLQINPGLIPQQVLAIQAQQNLLNNQIQHAQQASGPTDEAGITLNVTPNTLQINSPVGLTQEQVVNLQNQQILLNSQVQQAAAGLGQPDGKLLFASNQQDASLASIQQQNLLASELVKSGIDPSQLQLTNVPLSSVSALPGGVVDGNLRASGINNGLNGEVWGRYGRETGKEKKEGKKAKGE